MGFQLFERSYEGSWSIKEGKLFKGNTQINENYELIDDFTKGTQVLATVFQNDTRIATNVQDESGAVIGMWFVGVYTNVISAQSKVAAVVNSAMVQAYWEIGEQIYLACDRNDRAEYGKNLLKYLSEELTREFGKGYTERNLRNMRQFYQLFPNWHTVCAEFIDCLCALMMRSKEFFIKKNV